jgi:hypothetical protein
VDTLNLNSFDHEREFRKGLVPIWMKIFGWVSVIFAILIVTAYGLSFFDSDPGSINIGMYGFFYKGTLYSALPILLSLLILCNGISAYALLTGRKWALSICLHLAYITLVTCVVGKLNYPTNYFPFEFLIIIPYIYFLHKNSKLWKNET